MARRTLLALVCMCVVLVGCKYSQHEYNQGLAFHNDKKLDAAIECYSSAIQLNGKFKKAYFRRGAAQLQKERYSLAVSDFSQVLNLANNHHQARLGRGMAHALNGSYELAREDFDQLIDDNPNTAFVDAARELSEITATLEAKKNTPEGGQPTMPTLASITPRVATPRGTGYGYLGGSQFFVDHPVWSRVIYYSCLFVAFVILEGVYWSNNSKTNDGAKAGNTLLLLILFGSAYLASWGYQEWGWLIGTMVCALMLAGATNQPD